MSRNPVKNRIVIAEDDDAILELVKIRLEIAGYDTVLARDGLEALERIDAATPSGMVLDIGLPRLDGFGVLMALAQRRLRIPTLMLTARHSSSDFRKAIGLGASDFLAKPFDDKALLEKVRRMMQPKPASDPVCLL
jgi:DNA-binding response OmpR family regulator